MEHTLIIDAKDMILGRLAAQAAKKALQGEKIMIVNCEHAIISGKRLEIVAEYMHRSSVRGTWAHGPFIHRVPYKFVKRTIRGMLPHKQERGKDALKRITCYNGTPDALAGKATISYKGAHASRIQKTKHITIRDLCTSLGGKA